MCNRRCLHSSMIGILCTASWGRPKSFAVVVVLNGGCRLCFVVNRVEEHVGEGGSRSS